MGRPVGAADALAADPPPNHRLPRPPRRSQDALPPPQPTAGSPKRQQPPPTWSDVFGDLARPLLNEVGRRHQQRRCRPNSPHPPPSTPFLALVARAPTTGSHLPGATCLVISSVHCSIRLDGITSSVVLMGHGVALLAGCWDGCDAQPAALESGVLRTSASACSTGIARARARCCGSRQPAYHSPSPRAAPAGGLWASTSISVCSVLPAGC